MREIYVTIGPSGAGKTYWATHSFVGVVFDSDRYREIVCGDSTDQKHNNEVFQFPQIYAFFRDFPRKLFNDRQREGAPPPEYTISGG